MKNKPKSINISKIISYFHQKDIDKKTLNKLFYYSLFDSRSFEEDEDFFPALMVRDYREKIRNLLKKIFTKKQPEIYNFLDSRYFDEFESKVIANDTLSRIILSKQLSFLKIKTTLKKSDNFDLKTENGVNIELKRIVLWTNYSQYLNNFLNKINKNENFLYVVTCTHPFAIKRIISNFKEIRVFNKYIEKIIKSHYIVEKLIKRENIKFIIEHITPEGKNEYNLESLCNKIKRKLDEW